MKMNRLLTLIFLLVLPPAMADTGKTQPEKKPPKQVENKAEKNQEQLDWGDWEQKFKPQQRYGVGIKGKVQNAINAMDKSNLINDSNGVQTSPASKQKKSNKTLNIKKMKAELKALEKKVEQEIDDDIDY